MGLILPFYLALGRIVRVTSLSQPLGHFGKVYLLATVFGWSYMFALL